MEDLSIAIDGDEIQETEEVVIARLRENSLEWVESDDRESDLRVQLKHITDRKKILGPIIEADLQKLNKTELTLRRGGKLRFTTTTTTTSVKREDIVSALKSEVADDAKVESIVGAIFDKSSRSGKTVTSLKRTKK